jgi:hypothetical protein
MRQAMVTMAAVVLAWSAAVMLWATPASQVGQQPAVTAPAGEASLGTVRIPRRVLADGKPLPAGTYRLRLTAETAKPEVPGQTTELARWVEFLQGNQVKGREVATLIPQAEVREVAKTTPPPAGSARVELLKGNEFVRIWIHRGGVHYLIHLPVAS